MKKSVLFLILGLVVGLCSSAFAQGVAYNGVATLDTGRPAQGINVRVCATGSTGTPCTPTASIFSDAALSVGLTNPVQSDSLGNVNFYAACGKYDLQYSGNGVTTRTTKDVQVGPCQQNSGSVLAANGFSQIVQKFNFTSQSANMGTTTVYTVPANAAGLYRVSAYLVETQIAAGGTPSSTLPNLKTQWVDLDTGVANGTGSMTTTGITNNTLGVSSAEAGSGQQVGSVTFNAKASTNITIITTGYASVGTTPMLYAVHGRVEYLGN